MKKIEILNKKASFSYKLSEFYTAGIQLKGSEIKSIRNKEIIIKDSYCILINGEVWSKNIHISKYKYDTSQEFNPNRDKKLLLNKNEIKKIINEKGMAKVELGLGKGKKLFDKREDLKKKDVDKQIQRIKKRGN